MSSTASGVARSSISGYKTTYSVLKSGGGKSLSKGGRAKVHATGSVSGKKFWSTKDAGQVPFEWEAGVGQVICGWDQGVLGMREGEVRLLSIPHEEGYGVGGFPAWGIPPCATLDFEIELLSC